MNTMPGVILASTLQLALSVRNDLGLTDWVAVEPGSVHFAANIGRAQPRLLVVTGADPYAHREPLLKLFGGQNPAVYWLTGSAL